jgi:tetraacyldisaccharide 4'-kinase
VVVNVDRVAGARAAIDQGADVLVMDDGFQHRRLQRDLDIVLIDGTNPFGYGYCLPRGLLREGPWALRDAGAIVITRSDRLAPDRLERLRNRLFALAPRAGIHLAVHAPTGVIDEKGERLPPSWLCDKTVFAFCGIANPSSFFETLTSLGAQLAGAVALDDHVDYSPEVLERLRQEAARCKGQVLMTTQKDFVKLTGADLGAPVLQLAVEMQIVGGQAELLERIKAACEGQ